MIPPRPRELNFHERLAVAQRIALDLSNGRRREHLAAVLTLDDDGETLALKLNSRFDWPLEGLAAALEGVADLAFAALIEKQRAWAEQYRIAPTLARGQRVTTRFGNVGEIDGVSDRFAASYRVKVDGWEETRFEERRLIAPFEEVSPL